MDQRQAAPPRPASTSPARHNPAIVLVGCGARKSSLPAIAAELYIGPYFRSCLQAALAIAPRERVLVISARYGLLGLDDGPLAPYELTLGEPGAVTVPHLRRQAADRGLAQAPAVALCGIRYASLAGQVWDQVNTPLAGLGIGEQRHVLAVMRASRAPGRPPQRRRHGSASAG